MGHKQSLKQGILDKCEERNDEWASQVRVRICGAVSDLHAADARYHKSCRVSFMSPKSTSAAQRAEQESHKDKSLQFIVHELSEDQSKV